MQERKLGPTEGQTAFPELPRALNAVEHLQKFFIDLLANRRIRQMRLVRAFGRIADDAQKLIDFGLSEHHSRPKT